MPALRPEQCSPVVPAAGHVGRGRGLADVRRSYRAWASLIGLVRAGEASGAMEEVLGRLADYIEKTERMKKKIKINMNSLKKLKHKMINYI